MAFFIRYNLQIISEKNLRATTSKVLFFIREDAVEYSFKPIFRSLLSSKQFKNEKCLKVWIWCLLKATDNDFVAMVGRQEVPLKRGQFIFGRIDASEELSMSQSTVWFWMKFLQEDGSINIKSNNKFSIISLSNIAKWDNILDSLLNNKKTTKRQQKDTYNKDNKEKKENNNTDTKVSLAKPTGELQELIDFSKEKNFPIQGTIKINRYNASNLLKKFGLEKSKKLVLAAVDCRGKPYAPQVNDFIQLYRKCGDLVNFYTKEKNEKRGYRI